MHTIQLVTDPRIARTRAHVLSTVRTMLTTRNGERLTFTAVAEKAMVSRRTLYIHWGTIQNLLGEAVSSGVPTDAIDTDDLSPREVLRSFLTSVRDDLVDPISTVALTSLMSQAVQDDRAAESLASLTSSRVDQLSALLGPVDPQHYSQVIGPIYFTRLVMRGPVTDAAIESLTDRGVELLGLGALQH